MEKLILLMLFPFMAFADEAAPVAEKSIIDAGTTKQVIDFITGIPKLGTVGIIASIVLALIGIAFWFWKNDIINKATQRQTEKKRAEDQAKTVTENQDQSKEYNDAHKKLEEERKAQGEDESAKPDIPDEP